jgi:hypothetical protein
VAGENLTVDASRGTDELALVVDRELEPATSEELGFGASPHRLRVQEEPIVVEDHRVRQAHPPTSFAPRSETVTWIAPGSTA